MLDKLYNAIRSPPCDVTGDVHRLNTITITSARSMSGISFMVNSYIAVRSLLCGEASREQTNNVKPRTMNAMMVTVSILMSNSYVVLT